MENLNAETVKEWLEVCAEDTPYPDQSQALHDALALINSQEQRIKELAEENERLTRLANLRQRDLDNANDLLFKAEDEIERSRADTILKYSGAVYQLIFGFVGEKLSEQDKDYIMLRLGQIGKEMLEGENERPNIH